MNNIKESTLLSLSQAWFVAFVLFLTSFLFALPSIAVEIPLHKRGDVYTIPVRINGVITLNFILDSGASEVAIPADVVMTLIRAGTITDGDFLPGKTYQTADGSKLKSERFTLHEMEFGGIRIANVPCSVTPPAGDLLLGQSLLGRLDSWSLDNKKHVLIVGNVKEGADLKLNLAKLPPGSALTIGSGIEGAATHSSDIASSSPRPMSIGQLQGSEDFKNAYSAYQRGDYSEALKKFKSLAERGDARAQFQLGGMYSLGHGVRQDWAEAVKWVRKAAEQGNVQAEYLLGLSYRSGMGVPKDYSEAFTWFRKAGDQGEPDAEFELGRMYQNGEGVSQDFAEAVKWFWKSAEQGDAWGQFGLGGMYERGEGVAKDYAEAAKWYRKAAEQGHSAVQLCWGKCISMEGAYCGTTQRG